MFNKTLMRRCGRGGIAARARRRGSPPVGALGHRFQIRKERAASGDERHVLCSAAAWLQNAGVIATAGRGTSIPQRSSRWQHCIRAIRTRMTISAHELLNHRQYQHK